MKYLNWGLLAHDIMEILGMNQTQIAEKCNVTQQSVSNWKTGVRSPGVFARNTLRDLSKESKLKLDNYKVSVDQRKSKNPAASALPEEVLAFVERLAVLSKKKRERIMEMAEFMIKKS